MKRWRRSGEGAAANAYPQTENGGRSLDRGVLTPPPNDNLSPTPFATSERRPSRQPPSGPSSVSGTLQRSLLTPEGASRSDTLKRKKSLVKPERSRSIRRNVYEAVEENGHVTLRRSRSQRSQGTMSRSDTILRRALGKAKEEEVSSWWVIMSRTLTCCCANACLRAMGKRDPYIQQAYREKLALCIIIFVLMGAVGYLTFGFNSSVCGTPEKSISRDKLKDNGVFMVRGIAYTVPNVHPAIAGQTFDVTQWAGKDLSAMFPVRSSSFCGSGFKQLPCVVPGVWNESAAKTSACHTVTGSLNSYFSSRNSGFQGKVFTPWDMALNPANNLIIYNGLVWDVSTLNSVKSYLTYFDAKVFDLIEKNRGKDATIAFMKRGFTREAACMTELFGAGIVDSDTIGCVFSTVVLYVSLVVILGVVLARFFLAVIFAFVMGWRLGERGGNKRSAEQIKRRRAEWAEKQKQIQSTAKAKAAQQLRENSLSGVELQDLDGNNGSSSSQVGMMTYQQQINLERQRQFNRFSTPSDITVNGSNRNSVFMPKLNKLDEGDKPWGSSVGSDNILREPTLPNIEDGPTDDRMIRSTGQIDLPKFRDLSIPVPELDKDPILNDPTLMHSLIMVPCYSEGYASLRMTLDSVANTYYPATHKVIFAVADGIIQGAGNAKPTSDILIDMMEVDERFKNEDPRFGGRPAAYSYVAIADGAKRKNCARVYAGWYRYSIEEKKDKRRTLFGGRRQESDSTNNDYPDAGEFDDNDVTGRFATIRNRKEGRVPMILVVKVGNEEEQDPERRASKPGNRGKRDSQVILMNFLSKVMFDDRMTPMEFDIFYKLWTITGVHPDKYEGVLCVDADTMVYPDSITHMVAVLLADPMVMGLCGETKVSNKWGSWVTMIQVFEYYISHHLSKAFESIFGGVTCLPGCFCMYRIKAPKNDGSALMVPVLANPDIVEEYSENIVDTLHKKNLLLLGEDRYLSTLMLRTFPKRKMMFVPLAICKTTVPDEFMVLLSQRRRWINSTIHNLLELLMVRDLCGTFCISMQFVIFMELVGTVVLPAAITFTIVLVVRSALSNPTGADLIPLFLLAAILGLPAVLIVLTASRLIYAWWMVMYLFSLPIWNFILPLYAFWNFDDFTWGETRKTTADKKGEDHGRRDGDFDGSGIHMRRWLEWMEERKVEAEKAAELERLRREQEEERAMQEEVTKQIHMQMQVRPGGLVVGKSGSILLAPANGGAPILLAAPNQMGPRNPSVQIPGAVPIQIPPNSQLRGNPLVAPNMPTTTAPSPHLAQGSPHSPHVAFQSLPPGAIAVPPGGMVPPGAIPIPPGHAPVMMGGRMVIAPAQHVPFAATSGSPVMMMPAPSPVVTTMPPTAIVAAAPAPQPPRRLSIVPYSYSSVSPQSLSPQSRGVLDSGSASPSSATSDSNPAQPLKPGVIYSRRQN